MRHHHRRARLLRRDEARAERELREDDPAEPAVHQELPDLPERPARPGQRPSGRRREHRRRHLRSAIPRSAEAGQRPALSHAGCRSRMGEVAVDAGRALDRGDRGGLSRRPGDAGLLQRLAAGRRAAEAEHRPLRHRRQPRRQQFQVEHDLRAAARQGARHRQAHRLSRAVEGARREASGRNTSSPRRSTRRSRPRRRRRSRSTSSVSPS